MDVSERRVIGGLLLLSGFTFLAVGLYAGQLSLIWEFIKEVFEAAVAGAP